MADEKVKVSFGEKVKKFFRDYKSEFKKISWPSFNGTVKKTVMVIVAVLVISLCIFLVDSGFGLLFDALQSLAH